MNNIETITSMSSERGVIVFTCECVASRFCVLRVLLLLLLLLLLLFLWIIFLLLLLVFLLLHFSALCFQRFLSGGVDRIPGFTVHRSTTILNFPFSNLYPMPLLFSSHTPHSILLPPPCCPLPPHCCLHQSLLPSTPPSLPSLSEGRVGNYFM